MKPILLCILDGVGIREENYGNAVKQANMPNFNNLMDKYPHSLLEASGPYVGLPEGQMGNSEVGHGNIGAGRVVYQPLEIINNAIKNHEIENNEEINKLFAHVKKNNSKLHIAGLLSDGGIHSHINHLFKLIDVCKEKGIDNLYIHAYLDGRDTLPNVALKYLDQLQKKLDEVKIGKIATISGRYYSMDRDNRWERIKLAYDAMVFGKGPKNSYQKAIEENYNNKAYDEFIIPTIINEDGNIEDNDGVLVFNFRPDRLRELNMVLTNPNFHEFESKKFNNLKLVTMMPVSSDVICTNAFHEQDLTNTLGEYLSKQGLKQLRIAETEKYAHVTYFFDGGKELDLEGCRRILIPSPKVATYDLKSEMSAYEITDTLLKEIDKDIYDFIVLNFANGDMVGHTGNMKATSKAMETSDECIGKIYNKIEEKHGVLLITADHGNSDNMLDKEGRVLTAHSMSKVPFIVTLDNIKLKDGKLADIAPTILKIMGIDKPQEMTGINLMEDN